MKTWPRSTLILLSLAAVTGLSGCTSAASSVDCKQVTVPSYAAMTAWSKCTTCHSSALSGAQRAGAPADINFDNYDAAVMDADRALSEVDSGAMPPAGSAKLSAAEHDQIINWASCDTPK